MLKIKIDKNLNENKFLISVSSREEEKTDESKIETNLFQEKKDKTNKRDSIRKKDIKSKENTIKRKPKNELSKEKKAAEHKPISKDKKPINKKTIPTKTKIKRKQPQKTKKDKVSEITEKKIEVASSQKIKKGWWKK